jgi:hypothetical protein
MSIFNKTIKPKTVRVRYTVVDDTDSELFKLVGEWNGIGSIFYDEVDRPSQASIKSLQIAKPFFSNIKNYPLQNELVFLLLLSDSEVNEIVSSTAAYYFSPINIWGHPNHNAIPDLQTLKRESLPNNVKQDYPLTKAGVVVRRVEDTGTDITLGKTFRESQTIHPLKYTEGDVQIEGRFGQSLNLTSNTNTQSPVTILRTGQKSSNEPSWIPLEESVNEDSNILLQSVDKAFPVDMKYTGKGISETQVSSIGTYKDPQTLINSDRVTVLAKKDSVLLHSEKLSSITSNNNLYLEAKTLAVIDSANIKIGGSQSQESVILGDTFLNDLQKLLTKLSSATLQLSTILGNLGVPVNSPVAGILLEVNATANNIAAKIVGRGYQSDKVKVGK